MAELVFLIWTVVTIFLTINVFLPLAKKTTSSIKVILSSFISGWLIGDLLPQWIILNLCFLLIFSYSDFFYSPLGLGGIICHSLCWIILSFRLKKILNTPERLNQKMLKNFGSNWKKSSSIHSPPKNFLDIDWKSWFNPLNSLKDPRVYILRDQVFHKVGNEQLKLDIYRPKNIKKKCPGILQIHGGAWITGSKQQASFFLVRMALQGWVCFSVTHRFSPKIVFPEHLIDVKRALKWIRENADKHGLDKNFIISKGGSSGGHLASLMALTQNNSEFQPGFENTDTSIQGCVSMYGVFDFTQPFEKNTQFPAKSKVLKTVCGGDPITKPSSYKKISPVNWISEKTPPFLLIQGETDALITAEETNKFWKDLQNKKISCSAFLRIPLVGHGFDVFPTLTAQCILPTVETFVKMLYNNFIRK